MMPGRKATIPRECSTGRNGSDNTIWLTSTADVAREIISESFMRVKEGRPSGKETEKANIVAADSVRIGTATQIAGGPAREDLGGSPLNFLQHSVTTFHSVQD